LSGGGFVMDAASRLEGHEAEGGRQAGELVVEMVGGEPKRLVVESPWSQLTSECQRFWHPPRLDK
jgi:hypothetical protein